MPFLRRSPRQPSRGWFFRTKQPHHWSWLLALILAIVGVLGTRIHIDYVSEPQHAFYIVLAAYIVLALATVIDGL